MAVRKISVSLDEEVFERAHRAAEQDGTSFSAWLSQAAEAAAELAEARAAVEEYFRTHGEPDEEIFVRVEKTLDAAGVGKPVSPEETARNQAALARIRNYVPDRDAARKSA